jgi:hypothetical protein
MLIGPAQAQAPVMNFGDVELGHSASLTTYGSFYTDPSGGTITVTGDGISGPNESDFTSSDDSMVGVHPDGGSGSITFTFTPTELGPESASWSFNSYVTIDGVNYPASIEIGRTLEGTGVAAVPEASSAASFGLLFAAGAAALLFAARRRRASASR